VTRIEAAFSVQLRDDDIAREFKFSRPSPPALVAESLPNLPRQVRNNSPIGRIKLRLAQDGRSDSVSGESPN